MTAETLITRALRSAGILGEGETASSEMAQSALTLLNGLIDSWRADRLAIDHITRNTFTATNGVSSYTLGPTGTWVYATVPTWIDHASVVLVGSDPAIETPLEVLTPQRYELVTIKAESFSPLAWIYYERTAPNGTVRVWPVPDQSQTVVLYLLSPLSEFTALTTDVDLPSGYADALAYSLAVRLTVDYGRPLNPLLKELADKAVGLIKSANVFPSELTTDRALWAQGRGWSRADFLRGY